MIFHFGTSHLMCQNKLLGVVGGVLGRNASLIFQKLFTGKSVFLINQFTFWNFSNVNTIKCICKPPLAKKWMKSWKALNGLWPTSPPYEKMFQIQLCKNTLGKNTLGKNTLWENTVWKTLFGKIHFRKYTLTNIVWKNTVRQKYTLEKYTLPK